MRKYVKVLGLCLMGILVVGGVFWYVGFRSVIRQKPKVVIIARAQANKDGDYQFFDTKNRVRFEFARDSKGAVSLRSLDEKGTVLHRNDFMSAQEAMNLISTVDTIRRNDIDRRRYVSTGYFGAAESSLDVSVTPSSNFSPRK